ncbi:MAG: alpha-galactosidase [Firmicutes bacterium]|nr:alpha-galactosidase [[Eubacterium] siraeum]MCM1489168.1 alpha-galactosidase [Bacillota bacterium]
MAVIFNEKDMTFFIETDNSEYQLMADKFGLLRHLWYGGKVGMNMDYLQDYPNVGFSGNIYEAGNDRSYSIDTLPLEYSGDGIGDYRCNAVSVQHSDGSCALDLRYCSHKIYKGKYGIEGLPAVYEENPDNAETLEITLKDTATDVYVTLKYGVLPHLDIITRCAVIENKGADNVYLTNAASLCLDIPRSCTQWIHFSGRHNSERTPIRLDLFQGIQESSSRRGASSHQQNPAVILCGDECTETNGSCIGAMLMYSGSFSARAECDQFNQVRFVMGINPELFRWELKFGEGFSTPEAVLSYSGNGFEKLSHNFHKAIRNNVCRGKYKLAERPVLINSWEAAYFTFDDEKLLSLAKSAAELGIDMLVLDDGWFGKRNDDCSGLGDWYVNTDKIKGGLGKLADSIKALDMKLGIWFEPEMISEDSELYRSHPDWAIAIPGRKPNRSRFQLVLDMTREDVRDYLYGCISDILRNAEISYVKWDMNRSACDWFSHCIKAENMGEMPHRYILGVYELLQRLTTDFPNVLFEGCSGGGGRFDGGMLYYCPQIWCSDDTDAYERTRIQYGTSFFYPISAMGSHVSAVPNHQTGRITSFEARAVTAMSGSFGYELDPTKLSDEEREQVREQIKRFKRYGKIIHGGDYYRLTDPLKSNLAVWEYVSEDKKEILVHGMQFRAVPSCIRSTVKLRGLDEGKNYKINGDSRTYTGRALMNSGILLPASWGDFYPYEFYITETE